jgi:hypothetical protein
MKSSPFGRGIAPNVWQRNAVVFGAKKITIAQTENTKPHQKPLSDLSNPFQLWERRCAACYTPPSRLTPQFRGA